MISILRYRHLFPDDDVVAVEFMGVDLKRFSVERGKIAGGEWSVFEGGAAVPFWFAVNARQTNR